jgi:regulator of replication initiation timing
LIAYKYGRISEVQVQNIEKNLAIIIQQFEEMKKDLVFLLSENGDQQN